MSAEAQNSSPAPSRFWGALILSSLTALFATATVLLHFIGVVKHSAYLRHWGIDAGLFPKASDWLLINGYYGLADRFIVVLGAVISNLPWLLGAALALGLYVFMLLSPVGIGKGKLPQWLLGRPEWFRRMLLQVLATGLIVGALPITLFLIIAFMVAPMMLGERAGIAIAEANSVEYAKGCEKSKYQCVQLKRNGKLIAVGFVIDDSPEQIAIFDTEIQRSRTIPRAELEMTVSRLPFAPQ